MEPPALAAHLLAHEHFVRLLLRGLLRDDAAVDDAIQDLWLRTLQRPGAVPRDPRPWLARVARNLAVSNWRRARRQAQRDRAHGAGEPIAESPEQSQLRLELRQRVTAAILALGEPYQPVVLLRYEQQRSIGEIAAQLGRSAATVRSQLSRAHELLRQRLDRDYGDRERWTVLALPLLAAAAPTTVPAGAVLLGGGLAAVAAVWVTFWFGGATPTPAPPVRTATEAVPSPPPAAAPPAVAPTAATTPTAAAETGRTEVRVVQRLLPRAELFEWSHYCDYELATFSFEWGLRDDPGCRYARNDWDVAFTRDELDSTTVTDDQGTITDLGVLAPADFGTLPVAAAPLAFAASAKVQAGHAYFVHTLDTDSDLATVAFVREHVPGRRVVLDWYCTDGSGRAQGSLLDPGTGRPWTTVLAELRARAQSGPAPSSPVVLQLRNGAGGGNPNRVDFAGRTNGYVRSREAQPLALGVTPDRQERSQAYVRGGFVPGDRQFVVTDVVWRGGAVGDSNGSGRLRVCVAGEMLAEFDQTQAPIQGSWHGRLVIVPGAEDDTWCEIANSSWVDVQLFGHLEPLASEPPARFGGTNAGFFHDPPPVVAPPPVLREPSVRLQAQTGQFRNRQIDVDLRGRAGLTSFADGPIAITAAPSRFGAAWAEGGCVPAGKRFVVTSVRARGHVHAQPEGIPTIRLLLDGRDLAGTPAAGPFELDWTGRVVIRPGDESRTRLMVHDGCAAEVEFSGHFEDG